jgi:hypothetical protein
MNESPIQPFTSPPTLDPTHIAEATRQACIQAALTAFEDASMNGLCCEGAWESAVGATQGLDLRGILEDAEWSRFALDQFLRGTDDDVDYSISDAEEVYNA